MKKIVILLLLLGVAGCEHEKPAKKDSNPELEQPSFDRNDRRAENRYDPE